MLVEINSLFYVLTFYNFICPTHVCCLGRLPKMPCLDMSSYIFGCVGFFIYGSYPKSPQLIHKAVNYI